MAAAVPGLSGAPDHEGKTEDAAVNKGVPEFADNRVSDESCIRGILLSLRCGFFRKETFRGNDRVVAGL